MKYVWVALAVVLLAGCAVVPLDPYGYASPSVGVGIGIDPYYYSPSYCVGCWYGEWAGRVGYHRGGGRQWEGRHTEADHHGQNHGRDIVHEGHR
jgi:hypothetical protein